MTDEAAWLVPAQPEQVSVAVAHVLTACEPGVSDDRARLFHRMIDLRGYSAAELAYAARELPYDEIVNDKLRFNRPVMPADFERVIQVIRKKRSRLRSKMRLSAAEELVMEYPEELSIEHFHVCDFDDFNRQLVRYAPHLPPRVPTANPVPQEVEGAPSGKRTGQPLSKPNRLGDTKAVGQHLPDEDDEIAP